MLKTLWRYCDFLATPASDKPQILTAQCYQKPWAGVLTSQSQAETVETAWVKPT